MQHRHGHTVLTIVHDQRTRRERRVPRASEQKSKNSHKTHKKYLISTNTVMQCGVRLPIHTLN